jgi:hypothetical protein
VLPVVGKNLTSLFARPDYQHPWAGLLRPALFGYVSSFWPLCLADRDSCGRLLEILTVALSLRTPLWWEAIRVRALPRVPEAITLFDSSDWADTLKAFQGGSADEAKCRHAGSQLLLDAWLYFAGATNSPEESPFHDLVTLTRDDPSAVLRVAHCIRDIVCGNAPRIAALKAMVASDDPEFQTVFREAFWID